jgi:cyclohexanone monooxygenase
LNLPEKELNLALEAAWQRGGSASFQALFTDTMTSPEANEKVAQFVRSKIRQIVNDAATAELLVPKDHPFNTKRLCVDSGYYETFNRNNVTLVDVSAAPIVEISEIGIRTAAAHYPVDVIVFATGFDAMTGALREIDIRGRHGLKLSAKWAAGPLTYLGLMVAGFPNMFIVAGPGSPSVKSNMVFSIEQHVEWIADCLDFMRIRRMASIEASESAERDWVAHVNEVTRGTLYPLARSWYSGANIPGKREVFMPYIGGTLRYRKICEAVAANNYHGFVFAPDLVKARSRAGLVSETASAAD